MTDRGFFFGSSLLLFGSLQFSFGYFHFVIITHLAVCSHLQPSRLHDIILVL
jgi:hypothetical protein